MTEAYTPVRRAAYDNALSVLKGQLKVQQNIGAAA